VKTKIRKILDTLRDELLHKIQVQAYCGCCGSSQINWAAIKNNIQTELLLDDTEKEIEKTMALTEEIPKPSF